MNKGNFSDHEGLEPAAMKLLLKTTAKLSLVPDKELIMQSNCDSRMQIFGSRTKFRRIRIRTAPIFARKT